MTLKHLKEVEGLTFVGYEFYPEGVILRFVSKEQGKYHVFVEREEFNEAVDRSNYPCLTTHPDNYSD